MIGETRTIARFVELVHIPIQHDVDRLREVYLALSKTCGFENFTRQPAGATLESTTGESGATSRVTFARDRILFREELARAGLDEFRHRAEELIAAAAETLGIPLFVVRSVTVRALAAVPAGRAATGYIAEHLTNLGPERLAGFGRPAQVVGLRLHAAAADPKVGVHQVRIEAYLRDPRSIFIEDVATFKVPMPARDKERLAAELLETDEFVHERATAFLNQFP